MIEVKYDQQLYGTMFQFLSHTSILLFSTHNFPHCGSCFCFEFTQKDKTENQGLIKKKGRIKQKANPVSTNPDAHSWASQT